MTPTFLWVFLLALVGRTASVPRPLTVDACALICNPGAETEAERERDPVLYPRYPKVNCRREPTTDQDAAWIIASKCLKLCNEELSISMEVNCFALRSSLGANLGCFCEALTPLSPNTMRLHESWRLNFLVKELAEDIMTVILKSDLDALILCEIKNEVFQGNKGGPQEGKLYEKCKSHNGTLLHDRSRRSVEEMDENVSDLKNDDNLQEDEINEIIEMDEAMEDTDEAMEDTNEEILEFGIDSMDKKKMMEDTKEDMIDEDMIDITDAIHEKPHKRQIVSESRVDRTESYAIPEERHAPEIFPEFERDDDQINEFEMLVAQWEQVCSALCKTVAGPLYCRCDTLRTYTEGLPIEALPEPLPR